MTEKISLLVVQSNPVVGNIAFNKQIVIDHLQNNNSDLILFSELMLTGYPPEDLILKPAFMKKVHEAVDEIVNLSKGKHPTVVLGTPWLDEGNLFNAAVVIHDGKILHKH